MQRVNKPRNHQKFQMKVNNSSQFPFISLLDIMPSIGIIKQRRLNRVSLLCSVGYLTLRKSTSFVSIDRHESHLLKS